MFAACPRTSQQSKLGARKSKLRKAQPPNYRSRGFCAFAILVPLSRLCPAMSWSLTPHDFVCGSLCQVTSLIESELRSEFAKKSPGTTTTPPDECAHWAQGEAGWGAQNCY